MTRCAELEPERIEFQGVTESSDMHGVSTTEQSLHLQRNAGKRTGREKNIADIRSFGNATDAAFPKQIDKKRR